MTPDPLIDDETLMAYLDGELEASRAAAVEAALNADPALAQRLEAHAGLGARLKAAYDPALSEAIPERILQASQGGSASASSSSATVIELARIRAAKTRNAKTQNAKTGAGAGSSAAAPRRALGRRDWQAFGALAATLLVAVAVGQAVLPRHDTLIADHGGRLVASEALSRALDSQLAGGGDGPGIRVARVGVTFKNHGGEVCRSFTGAEAAGIACRQGGGWAISAVFAGTGGAEGSAGAYRMASGGDPRVMQAVGDMIEGAPFDATQEAAAKAAGWTAPSAAAVAPRKP